MEFYVPSENYLKAWSSGKLDVKSVIDEFSLHVHVCVMFRWNMFVERVCMVNKYKKLFAVLAMNQHSLQPWKKNIQENPSLSIGTTWPEAASKQSLIRK